MPLISVVMITYNHERYIREAIESVLNQSFSDFELIIVNDGSSDRTEQIIQSFSDQRIIYIFQSNQGPSSALNRGQKLAQGKYLALMSGDDVCHLNRLEIQYSYLEETRHKFLFTWVDFIDEHSKVIDLKTDNTDVAEIDWITSLEKTFNHPAWSQAEIASHFFWKGNCFCAPTLMCDIQALRESGDWCNTSIQLQDYEMWIRLIKKHNLYTLNQKTVKYRILGSSQNLSHRKNLSRLRFELSIIMKYFFDGFPEKLFVDAFSGQLIHQDFANKYEYELEKSFLYLKHREAWVKNIGLERLFEKLREDSYIKVAFDRYDFSLKNLFQMDFSGFDVFARHEEYRNKLNFYEQIRFFRVFSLARKVLLSVLNR